MHKFPKSKFTNLCHPHLKKEIIHNFHSLSNFIHKHFHPWPCGKIFVHINIYFVHMGRIIWKILYQDHHSCSLLHKIVLLPFTYNIACCFKLSIFFMGGKRSQLACFNHLSKGRCQSQYGLRPPTKQDNGLTKIKRPNMKQLVFGTI